MGHAVPQLWVRLRRIKVRYIHHKVWQLKDDSFLFFQMKPLPENSVLLRQCNFCQATFPFLELQVLISHLQYHIENEYQRREEPLACRHKRIRSRKKCQGLFFNIPIEMAFHCVIHCYCYWVVKQSPEHQVALEQTERERNELINHLAQNDLDDAWLFFPQN